MTSFICQAITRFGPRLRLVRNLAKHVVSEGHVCPLETCGKVCRTKNALRSHMVRIHGTSKIPRGQNY